MAWEMVKGQGVDTYMLGCILIVFLCILSYPNQIPEYTRGTFGIHQDTSGYNFIDPHHFS